ncbi:hypothetical protein LCGC14_0901080 [marine sediment metagenome]|uniref:Uncharacterized protein n=1 Tax=marine sediment metagenome TaxID=412755 RepID=A0A0F9P1D8_9ZZZZ
MAYTDLTDTFGYKVEIISGDLVDLMENDRAIQDFIPYNNRPALQRLSATEIRFKANNKSTADTEADVMFPDGSVVFFIQNNPVSNQIFDITRTADIVWPTVQGGLRAGLSEASNTWYAIYAVRITISPGVFTAVLVGDTTLPLQVNAATLNTRYGPNSWVYLGMVRNGDNGTVPSDLLDFVMVRSRTYFKNVRGDALAFEKGTGVLLATGTVTDLDWAYSPGVGATDIPDHIKLAGFTFHSAFDTVNEAKDSAGNHFLVASGIPGAAVAWRDTVIAPTEDGVKMFGGGAEDRAIHLVSFDDNVLGLGYSAQI